MRKVVNLVCLLVALLLAAPSAMHAGYSIQMGYPNLPLEPFSVGGANGVNGTGGRFTGRWFGGTTDITSRLIGGFWCVDVNNWLSTDKMSVDVTTIGAGYVSGNARKQGATFVNDNGTYDAQYRYKLAAALIAGYVPGSGGDYNGYSDGIKSPSNGTSVTADGDDTDIQAVIWWALDTNPTGSSGLHVTSLTAAQSTLYANAKTWLSNGHLNDPIFNRWLLFSPPSAGQPGNQAYLGEVPEPAFLGFLAAGLTGLYIARCRRLA
jgi:hypothetical protein